MTDPMPEPRRSRTPVIAAIGAVVVVAALAYFLLLRPKPEAAGVAAPTRAVAKPGSTATAGPGSTATAGPAAGSAAQGGGGKVEETFQIYELKNPFLPLVSERGGSSSVQVTPGGSSGAPVTRAPEPGSSAPSAGPGSGSASGGAVEPNKGTRVAMLEAPFTDGGRLVANVKVGSTVYKVGAGDAFANSFKVVSLDGSCGTFLFGDSRFSLCAGQEVLK